MWALPSAAAVSSQACRCFSVIRIDLGFRGKLRSSEWTCSHAVTVLPACVGLQPMSFWSRMRKIYPRQMLLLLPLLRVLHPMQRNPPTNTWIFHSWSQNSGSGQTQRDVCSARAPVICHRLPKTRTYFLIFLQRKLNCNNCAPVLEEPACRENFLCSSTGRLYFSLSLQCRVRGVGAGGGGGAEARWA